MNRRSFIQSLLAVAVAPVFTNMVSLIIPTHIASHWQVSEDPEFNSILFDTKSEAYRFTKEKFDRVVGIDLKSATYRHQISVGRGFKKIIYDEQFTLGSDNQ